ncbi:hypothetical protein FA95DRAFT_1610264, partial [Auriscalpium vulgare]
MQEDGTGVVVELVRRRTGRFLGPLFGDSQARTGRPSAACQSTTTTDDDELIARHPQLIWRAHPFMDPDIPVARLPPEILALIFSILTAIDRPMLNRSQTANLKLRRKNKLGWVTVTHVCQRWRTIALRNPLLWASNIALPSQL